MGDGATDWSGKHVVITGGSSGIGEALAIAAASKGATLTLLARGADRLASVAGPIGATGVPCDVSDRDAVTSVLGTAAVERGPVDVLVCSAGITLPGRFL